MSGDYTTDGAAVTFGPMATTRMACERTSWCRRPRCSRPCRGLRLGDRCGRPAAPDRRDRARPPAVTDVRLAHVRERHAPTGAPWRFAAALDAGDAPRRWLDLEAARRRPWRPRRARPQRAGVPATDRDARRPPGRRPSRRGAAAVVEQFETRGEPDEDEAVFDDADLRPRSFIRRRCGTSTRSSGTSGRCGRGGAARSRRRGSGYRSSTSATCRKFADPAIPSGRARLVGTRLRTGGGGPRRHTGTGSRHGRRRSGDRRLPDPQ